MRPTKNNIKETLFNWLHDYILDALCFDIFAGSGSLGIEAISRGAFHTVFIEKNNITASNIARITQKLNILDKSTILHENAIKKIKEIYAKYSNLYSEKNTIVFIDPPFAYKAQKLIELFNGIALIENNTNMLIVLETKYNQNEILVADKFNILKSNDKKHIKYFLLEKKPI